MAAASFVPPMVAERAMGEFERWKRSGRPLHPYILTSNWHVPVAWFVPFMRHRALPAAGRGGHRLPRIGGRFA